MLSCTLRRTIIRAPPKATLTFSRSNGSSSAPPPSKVGNVLKTQPVKQGSTPIAASSKALTPEATPVLTSGLVGDVGKTASATSTSDKVTAPSEMIDSHPPTRETPKAQTVAAEADRSAAPPTPEALTPGPQPTAAAESPIPEEREWHATVVHGRGILEPYRHPRTHGIPVAFIQFRAHYPERIQLAAHFASHAAASLGIPISGVVSLPTKRTLWTVPRGPFAHKKSQENFERRVHARAIKAFDADSEVVDRWVRYLEAHALPGVGLRVVRWHRLPIGIGRSHLQSVVGRMRLGRPTNKQKVKELGDKIVEVESQAVNQTASASAPAA
ncbi:hypothetical protein B0F90DRAFT_1726279 [Multifurca ochricompacta]|uniref:Small ribosomal subunit protein uS10 domain-containing protein n=1 Tax=Multifurca ochricompacta TaxID=376703 RepID=A0AAD4M2R9_9AGAM|nr:hypothetical protein B0F90DRAFT_1726279 [Multifurca ochricompacta]